MTPRDESGVSAVVGAVLLMALFTTAFTAYTLTTLPEWKADKEQAHQALVRQELGGLKADLEALAARRDAGPVTATVPLEVAKVALLQSAAARATIAVGDGFDADFSFTSPSLFFSDGAAVGSPSEGWGTDPCAGACVQTLSRYVVGLTTTGMGDSGDSATFTLTVTDSASGSLTVTLAHVRTASCGEVRLTVGTTTHYVEPCAGASLSGYNVDLMDDDYSFASAIARLEAPLDLTMTGPTIANSGGAGTAPSASATYLMSYATDAGLLRVAGTGTATTAPIGGIDGLRVVYSPAYQAFPSQDLVLEGGALLVDARNGQAVAVQPSLDLVVDGTRGSLSWTLVELTGDASSVSSDSATVSLTYTGVQDVVVTASDASVALATPTSEGWANHLRLALLAAGAGASATVTEDAGTDTVTLALTSAAGPVTQPWVIHLRVIQAEVEVA